VAIVVQKFGGTSVATSERIMAAARRAIQAKKAGNQVIVVVSARGDTTDELIAMAKEISEHPPARELDVLLSTGEQQSIALMAMAVQALGEPAVSFTGAQVGIRTDAFHTKARIKSISTSRILEALQEGKIVIVAGFQGVDEEDNITTLGRGGSDTTAVALAAAVGADVCEIYTDVDGVYTADPRVVPEARKLEAISFDEMLELASAGAKVMHSRSIEFAKKFGVPVHVRSSLSDAEGTWILPASPATERVPVCGAALVKDEARITITDVPDTPETLHQIFSDVAERHVVVDMIVQNIPTNGKTQISFTVAPAELHEALHHVREAAREAGAGQVHYEGNVSKVSVVGAGMRIHTGVANRMFSALAAKGINIKMVSTSEIKISVLVDRDRAVDALRAVHEAFQLDQPLGEQQRCRISESVAQARRREMSMREESLAAVVERLPAMEAIVVSAVQADSSQARVTVFNVPDRPGIAARVFRGIADAGVMVDMIVQNVSTEGLTHISFTVPREQVEVAGQQAQAVARELGGTAATDADIAKITLAGVGMRTHTGVAAKVFDALEKVPIPVHMVNTSEVDVSIVVSKSHAEHAADVLRRTFGLIG